MRLQDICAAAGQDVSQLATAERLDLTGAPEGSALGPEPPLSAIAPQCRRLNLSGVTVADGETLATLPPLLTWLSMIDCRVCGAGRGCPAIRVLTFWLLRGRVECGFFSCSVRCAAAG